jgi:NAD(P)-dependent dehydrogenase (short-subunit alcohol dehydrogenase family)
MRELEGQIALVNGGGSELGAGIAVRLAAEGARIAVLDEERAAIERTVAAVSAASGYAAAFPAKVCNKADAEAVVANVMKQFGRLDSLINASEYVPAWRALEQKSDDEFAAAFAVVQRARHLMTAVLSPMRALKGGSIVNLVTSLGNCASGARMADSKVAGQAVIGLTRSAAAEWGRYAIRVNALVAAADTDTFRRFRDARSDAVEWAIGQNPVRRIGEPLSDVGGAVLFLVSDDARYITGETIYADGGQHIAPAIIDPGLLTWAD